MEDNIENPDQLITGSPTLNTDQLKAINEKMASVVSPYYNSDKGNQEYNIDMPSFEGYIPQDQMFGKADLQRIRAVNQGTAEQLWNGVKQTVGKIPIGLVEQIGYLAEGAKYGVQAMTGNLDASQMDFNNGLTEWAKSLKQDITDAAPIYRENPNEVFDVTDPAWWIEHGSGLAESVGEFFALGYGVGAITKAGTAALTQGFIKSAQFLKYAKLGKLGAQLANTMNTVVPSVALAYAEGAMSGATVYKDIYDLGIQKINSEFIDEEGKITDEEAYNQAVDNVRHEAGLAAAKTTAINTAVVGPLNFSSIHALGGFKWRSRGLVSSLVEGENMMGWGKLWKTAAFHEAPKEGVEEVVNLIAENFGLYQGKENLGLLTPEERKSAFDLIIDTAFSEEGALNALLGAIGGVGQTVTTQGLRNTKLNEKLGGVFGETFAEENTRKKDAIKAALENNTELQKILLDYMNGRYTDEKIEYALGVDRVKINGEELTHETAADLMDQRIFQLYLSAMNSGTAEHIEEKMKALEQEAGEEYAPMFEEIKNDLKKTEKFYNEGMGLYGNNYAMAVPEYVHDRLKMQRSNTALKETSKDHESKLTDYKNATRPFASNFITSNRLNISTESLLNYLTEDDTNPITLTGEELSIEDRQKLEEFKALNKADLSIDTTLDEVNEAKSNLTVAERNHRLVVNSFNKNWFNDKVPSQIHNLKKEKLKDFIERENNKSDLQEDKDKNKTKEKPKEDNPVSEDPNNVIVEDEEDDVVEFPTDETTNANNAQNQSTQNTQTPTVEIGVQPKSKEELAQEKKAQKEKEQREKKERADKKKKNNLDPQNNVPDQELVEEPEIKPTAPNPNNINPKIEPSIAETPEGESTKKKMFALSVANRALNVNVVDGFVETAYDENGDPSLNETSKEATAILATPFVGVKEITLEVDENYKVDKDDFLSRKNDADRLPIKISIGGVHVGYMHDSDMITEGKHKGKNRLELHIYDDETGNLQRQIDTLKGVRKRIFDEYQRTGNKRYKTQISNDNKSHGTLIHLNSPISLKMAFNGASIQIGVVKDANFSVRTRDGIHKTYTTPYVPSAGAVVAILPTAKTSVKGKIGGITRYLKQNTVGDIRDQQFSENLKNLMVDFVSAIVTEDKAFMADFLDTYSTELRHISDGKIKLTNDLKTFKLLSELFFYVQEDLNSKLGKKLFHVNSKTGMIWMNPTEGLSIKDLKNDANARKTIEDYIKANIDSKYFTVNASMLGQQIAYPVYKDSKFVKSQGKVDYEKDFLSDTGILEADFKGLKLDNGQVVFFTDSVVEYGLPELIEPTTKKKEQAQQNNPSAHRNTEEIVVKTKDGIIKTTYDNYRVDGRKTTIGYKSVSLNEFEAEFDLNEISTEQLNDSDAINDFGKIKTVRIREIREFEETGSGGVDIFIVYDDNTTLDVALGFKKRNQSKSKVEPKPQSVVPETQPQSDIDIDSIVYDSFEDVQLKLTDIGVTSDIIKLVTFEGLHYIQTRDGKFYVATDSDGLRTHLVKEVTQSEIVKPFRTPSEWNKVRKQNKQKEVTQTPILEVGVVTNEAGIIPDQVAPDSSDLFGSIQVDTEVEFATLEDDDDVIEFSTEETSAANNAQSGIQEVKTETVQPVEQKPIIVEVSSAYGVVTADTNPTKEKTDSFISLITPQITAQAYKENNSATANDMFMYGLRWTRKSKAIKPLINHSYANGGLATNDAKANDGYVYDTVDQNGKLLAPLSDLQPIINELENTLGIDMSNYDAVIGNIYLPGQNIATHRDTTESLSARNYPVVVYTIGNNSGISIYENITNPGKASFASDVKKTINTKNGSVYTFGMDGKGRFEVAHDTPKGIKRNVEFPPITLPNGKIITNYTITLTFRRAADLTSDIPNEPAKVNQVKEQTKPVEQKPVVEVLDSLMKQERKDYFIQIGLDGSNQPVYLNQQQQIELINSFTNSFINQLYQGKSAKEAFDAVKTNIKVFADRCKDPNSPAQNVTLSKIFDSLYESFDARDKAGVKSLIINNLPSKGLKLTGNDIKSKKNSDPSTLVDSENDQELTDDDYILDEISSGQNNKFGNDSAAQDIFSKASQKVKRLISFLKVPEKNWTDDYSVYLYPITYKTNWATLPLFLDSKKVYNQLLEAVGDSQSLQEMKDRLYAMAKNGRTDMYSVLLNLNSADQSTQNEFYSVLAQQYNTYSEVTRSTNKKTQTQTFKRQDKNRNLATFPIVDNWNNNAKLLLFKNVDGKPVLNIAHINTIAEDLKNLKTKAGKGWDKETFDQNKDAFGRILRSIGIAVDDAFLEDYFRVFSTKSVRSNPINKDGNKVYPAFLSTLDNIGHIITDLKKGEYDNPFKEASGRMFELAEVEFLSGNYDVNSSFRMHKKGYYSYNSPFALRDLTDKLKDNEYYVRELAATPYSSTSYWLKSLLFEGQPTEEQLRFIRNFDAVILGGVRHTSKGNRSTEVSNLSPREREIANVNMLMAGYKFDADFNMNGTGYFVSNTISDKTTLPMFPVNLLPTVDGTLSGRLLDEIYESGVQSEINRMQLVNKQVNSTDSSLANSSRVAGFHYAKAYDDRKGMGFYFLNFDIFNKDKYIFDNRLKEEVTSSLEYKDYVKKKLKDHFDLLTTKKIEDWKSQDIIEGSGEQMKLTDNFDNNAKQNIRNFLARAGVNPTPDVVARYAAMFYEASSQLMAYNLRQITEDPATAGKPVFLDENGKVSSKGVFNLDASIKATWDNVNKRNAKWIAPGLRGNSADPYYIQVIVADAEYKLSEYNNPEYQELVSILNSSSLNEELRKSVIGKYEEINAGDGQEVTTIREHLGELHSRGMIDENQFKIASRILVKDTLSDNDFIELNELGIIFEPLKPVYSRSIIEDGQNLPKYIKTSSFPLIPFLTKGTKWDVVRKKMEALEKKENMPVRLTFKSGAKLGTKSKPITLFDSKGDVVDADLSQSMLVLDRQGLYLQQQPQEPKDKITQGTQETILNLQNFESHDKDGNEYQYSLMNGSKVRGSEMVDLYNRVHSRIIEESFNSLLHKNRLNAVETRNSDGEIQQKITDISSLRDSLVKELKSRGIGINSISALTTLVDRESKNLHKLYDEKLKTTPAEELEEWFQNEVRQLMEKDRFLLPLILHPQSKKLESVMMALITNNAIKLKLPGTSGILGTELGFDVVKVKGGYKDGITWIDKGRTGPLAKNEIILSWWFGKDFQEKTELYNLYKEGKVSIQELETFYGFRIPTGSPSFTSDFKVAGFFPPVMGTLTVTSRRVMIAMGSDFDVDTLKMYQHNHYIARDKDGNYRYDDNGQIVISKVPYDLNVDQLDKTQLQNLAIDLRIALATHPSRQLYRVLPNAYGGFKELAEQFQQDIDPSVGLNAMSTINDRNAFFDGQGGKAGVARFSLMVVGHTKAQLAKLYIKDFGGGIKFLNEDGSLIEEKAWNKEDYNFYDEDNEEEFEPTGLWRLDKIESIDGNLISNVLQYLQSGAVDNVNQLILRANHINKETFGVAGLMAQVGLNEDQISHFLKQPIIVKYVDQLIKLGDSFNEVYNPNEKQEIANKLYQEYVGIPRNPNSDIVGFKLSNLKEMLGTQTFDSSAVKFGEAQGDVLNAFIYYNELATNYNRVMSEYRQESKGAGKSVIDNIRINDNFEAVSNITSIGNKNNLNNLYYKTLQNVISQTESLYSSTLNGNPVLHNYTNIFRETVKNIMGMTGRTSFNEAFTNDVHGAVTSFLLTALKSITADSVADRRALAIAGTDTIVDQYHMLPSIIKQNKFLKQLQFYRTEEGYSVVKNDNGKIVDNIDDIHTAFIELLTNSNPEVNRFAKNLVKYSFVTGGNPFNPTGFHKYIPASYLIDNKIGEDFYGLNLDSVSHNFYEQFFQNNPNYTVGFKMSDGAFKPIIKDSKDIIKINFDTKNKEILSRYVVETVDGIKIFTQFISEYDPKAKSYNLYKLVDEQGTYQQIRNYYDLPIEMGDIYDFNRPVTPSILDTVAPTQQEKQSIPQNKVTANFNFTSGITAAELVNILKQNTTDAAQLIVLDALTQRSDLGNVKVIIGDAKIAGARAEYNSRENTITIDPNVITSDKSKQIKTLLEELVHAATVHRIQASMEANSNEKVLYERAIRIKKVIESKINEENEHKYDRIVELDQSNTGIDYVSAMRVYFNRAYQEGKSIKEQTSTMSPELAAIVNEGLKIVYPVYNEFEFIAHSLSNPEFQAYLKDQKYTGEKSIFEKILDLIAEVLFGNRTLKDIYGDIDETVFRQALEVAFAYTLGTNQQEFKKQLEVKKQEETKKAEVKLEIKKTAEQLIAENATYDPANGFELFPGVYTNEQQTQAINMMTEFLNDPDSDVFVLTGKGGTGKTTVMKKVIDLANVYSYAGGAVSHAAKKQLGNSIGQNYSHTLAALLGIKLDESTGKFTADTFARSKGIPIQKANLIIIDEMSMVSDAMLNEIMTLKKKSAKVIFMGDNHQLPPIGQDTNSKTFDLAKKEYSIELTQRMRQGEESPIVPFTDIVADNVERGEDAKQYAIGKSKRITNYDSNKDSGVVFTNDNDKAIQQFIIDLKKYAGDPNAVKIVTYNNHLHNDPESVKSLNAAIRQRLYGRNVSDEFQVGEIVTAYDSFSPVQGMQPKFYNSENFVVESVSQPRNMFIVVKSKAGTREFNFMVNDIKLKNDEGSFINVPVIAQSDVAKYEKAISDLFSDTDSNIKSLGYRVEEQIADLRSGFAITTHKAQGSTYRNAYVFEDNLLRGQNRTNLDKNKAFYTAITRPSKKLVVVGINNTLDEEAGRDGFASLNENDIFDVAQYRMSKRLQKPLC